MENLYSIDSAGSLRLESSTSMPGAFCPADSEAPPLTDGSRPAAARPAFLICASFMTIFVAR